MDEYRPTANVALPTQATQPVHLWPPSGRLGRLRLVAYSIGLQALVFALALVLGALKLSGSLAMLVLLLLSVVPYAVLLVQRSHDMNLSGWWSIAAFIPFVGLAWLLIPGSREANRFGLPPEPNSLGVKIVAWGGLLLVPGVGVLAAIAIPAYHDYTIKAKVAQVVNGTADCRARIAAAFQGATSANAPKAGQWGCTEGQVVGQWGANLRTNDEGVITVTFTGTGSSKIEGKQLALVPVDAQDRPLWPRDMPVTLAGFRCTTVKSAGIESRWMPASCRR